MGPWESVPATPAQRAARQRQLSPCDANQAFCWTGQIGSDGRGGPKPE
jgi:hypothetical protein